MDLDGALGSSGSRSARGSSGSRVEIKIIKKKNNSSQVHKSLEYLKKNLQKHCLKKKKKLQSQIFFPGFAIVPNPKTNFYILLMV